MGEVVPSGEGRVLYVVSTWVPEDQLAAWNRWHTEIHIPEVVAQPQIQRARKYRVIGDNRPGEWTPQYVTVYELDSLADWEAYDSGAVAAVLRRDYADSVGAAGKIARQVLLEEAEVSGDT